MKVKLLIVILFVGIFSIGSLKIYSVKASTDDIDKEINNILGGIDESKFDDLLSFLNETFNENKTLKDYLKDFFTGNLNFDFNVLLMVLTKGFTLVFNSVKEVVFYLLLLGIIEMIASRIICKNNDNSENNILFYIFYLVAISICAKIVYEVFNFATDSINNLSKRIDGIFPIMFSISGLIGNFGSLIIKPICLFLSFFTSKIIISYFLPILSISSSSLIVGNLSENKRYLSLNKTCNSLFKWSIGLLTLIFTIIVTTQVVANAQYNSASVKVLKYTTGSIVPVVGGFLSGGIDVLLSSAILVKNSVGIFCILYIVLSAGSSGVSLLILSFIIKFLLSICEPVLNKRFVSLLMGITDVFNNLASLILVCGYVYILTMLSSIFVSISLF